MPWGCSGCEVDASAVAAVSAGVPANAERCSTTRAAQALHVSERTVRNMIEAGTLLATRANRRVDSQRNDWRVVVRAAREFDPARKTLMTLDEAVKMLTNIGG
jgi:plasmid maintenance system antidote protein VapI